MAVAIGKSLAEERIAVVSGLAAGIDSSAHLGVIKNGGYTAAFLGCGILNIYPKENKQLSKMVEESGCLISEYHPEMKVSAGRLLSRNRLIAGLSSAVIVVEISEDSKGTMNTITHAREQAKGCYIYDPNCKVSAEVQAQFGFICFKDLQQLQSYYQYMILQGDEI
jgi:DNA processing protein